MAGIKQLAIWGTGADAAELVCRFPILNICTTYFIDSNCKEEVIFHNRKVVQPQTIDWSTPPFVIVATRRCYHEIAEFLINKQLKEGEDFTSYPNAYYGWLASLKDNGKIKRVFTLQEYMSKMDTWIPNLQNKMIENSKILLTYLMKQNINVLDAILQSVCNDEMKLIELKGKVQFEYSNTKDLSVIIEELLLNEDYYFESMTSNPFIIDGGANVGLAIYYFKQLYPEAQIIAFEPSPQHFDIIQRNVKRNNWDNVEVYPYALDGIDMENKTFYTQTSGLAGSLGKRNMEGVNLNSIHEIKVQSVRLSDYIHGKVDYLKLDIEGSETRVIEDIEGKLDLIDYIFIEYHEGQMAEDNSIAVIANKLEEAGFTINIAKSSSSATMSTYRPMEYVGKRISEVIWAKKKVLLSQGAYYKDLNLLRINGCCMRDDVSKISLYLDDNYLGDFKLNSYVNDENNSRGSEIWNSVFTKVLPLTGEEQIEIRVYGSDATILYRTVSNINVVSKIPSCYETSIGTKDGLTINNHTELDFYRRMKELGLKPELKILCIETSSICNLRCQYCLVGNNYDSIERGIIQENVLDEAFRIIKRIPTIRTVQLNALGEPLINPNLARICERIYKETSIRDVVFFTNGLLFHEEMAEHLSKIPLDFRITFSIDGHSPEENNRLRGGSDYAIVKNNLYNFLHKIVHKPNFRIRINNLLIDEENAESVIPEYLLNDFGFIAIDSHRTFYFPALSSQKLEDNGILIHGHPTKKVCVRCFHESTIRHNGDVIRCHWDSNCEEVMGNILHDKFEDIWWGEQYIDMRRIMSPDSCFENLPESCKRCHAMNDGYLYKK